MGNIDRITYLTGQALQGLLASGCARRDVEEIAVQMAINTEELLIVHELEKRARREKSDDN